MKHQKNIHVVYIITKLELGGAQKICLSLFNGMPGNNAFLISGTEGYFVDTVKNNPNALLLENFVRECSPILFFKELQAFFAMRSHLKKIKKKYPNIIIHTHSTKGGILGRWAAFFSGIKKRVHTIHGCSFHNKQHPLTWFFHYAIELITSIITTHYICVSSYDAQQGVSLFPRFTYKHSIVRAAIDWNQFYTTKKTYLPFPEKNKPFVFGTISCFKPQKNIFDLLRAFKSTRLKNPQVQLEIIGDGILKQDIVQWIVDNNLSESIMLHGWQNKVQPIIKKWHTFALTSLWEGLPCAIVEARMLNIPVISYNTGGIRDIITHQENGLLYKQNDWKHLAHGMKSLAENKNLYEKLQYHNDDLTDFNDQYMLEQHLDLYRTLK